MFVKHSDKLWKMERMGGPTEIVVSKEVTEFALSKTIKGRVLYTKDLNFYL